MNTITKQKMYCILCYLNREKDDIYKPTFWAPLPETGTYRVQGTYFIWFNITQCLFNAMLFSTRKNAEKVISLATSISKYNNHSVDKFKICVMMQEFENVPDSLTERTTLSIKINGKTYQETRRYEVIGK